MLPSSLENLCRIDTRYRIVLLEPWQPNRFRYNEKERLGRLIRSIYIYIYIIILNHIYS